MSTLSSGIRVRYNIVTSLVSIHENPREQFFVCSCRYFNTKKVILSRNVLWLDKNYAEYKGITQVSKTQIVQALESDQKRKMNPKYVALYFSHFRPEIDQTPRSRPYFIDVRKVPICPTSKRNFCPGSFSFCQINSH